MPPAGKVHAGPARYNKYCMSNISQTELALVVIGSVYLVLVAIYALWLNRSAEALLRSVKESEPAELWNELGAPDSIKKAVSDPQRRWYKFVRTKAYRSRCHPETVEKIDAFRSATYAGLGVSSVAGLVILYMFLRLPSGN